MFELETMLKGFADAVEGEVPLTLEAAREIAAKFATIRTALRRIASSDPKLAKQIANQALVDTH